MTVWWWLLLAAVAAVSLLLTGALRRYALATQMMDIPNARSSHSVPTPRGGGVAIVVSFLLCLPLCAALGLLDRDTAIALTGSGIGVAILGFLDDRQHIPARWRLLGHFSAAIWILFWIGGLQTVRLFGVELQLGWVGLVLTALYLVWMLNLYNFMDGIDGIASVQAITTCIGGALLLVIAGHAQTALIPLLLGGAVAGFLYWNFPPARIFMGDAGSGFLGLMLGALSLVSGSIDPELFWAWLILLGVFVVDATFTLLRRLLRGDRVYEAHRSHAYQYASRHFGRHLPVTLAVGTINLLWLLPLALLAGQGWADGAFVTLIAYAPLLALALRFHAGKAETQHI